MGTIDIIPDIHGQAGKLIFALHQLGWRNERLGWHHHDPNRSIVFLGDYIDRGPENARVIKIVRSLVDSGKAQAIMGNHELNALQFHLDSPLTGEPLRPHTPKNIAQHRSFLDEFPVGGAETQDVLAWMQTLPVFIDDARFRAVHACWDAQAIDVVKNASPDGVLTQEQLVMMSAPSDETSLQNSVECLTKGPEAPLPQGYSITDKDNNPRHSVRLRWWLSGATTWRDAAISVPVLDQLPAADCPDMLTKYGYPSVAQPVFFGHYWLSGDPVVQAPNALCLDYSAGLDGPLVTYEFSDACQRALSAANIHIHADATYSPKENYT